MNKFFSLERFIHSIKTVIACMLGFFVTKIIDLPADQWVVITIIVVMCAQIYVGSVLHRSYLRFFGTLIGCLFATVTLLTLGATNLAIICAIGVSSFIFSYIATGQESLSYAGTLGAVTTAIIMLGQHPTLIYAIERFLEISLGILIATFVSQFILPIEARTHLRRAQAETLEQLRDYYIEALINYRTETTNFDYQGLDESLVKSLLKQRQLAKESAPERFGGLAFDPAHFSQFLTCEREMLRAITFMHYALIHIDSIANKFIHLPIAHTFNETLLQSLNTLIKTVRSDTTPDAPIHLPSLIGMKEELQKYSETHTANDLIYIDGFIFSAEILTNSLAKLAKLYQITVPNQNPLNPALT